MSGSTDNIAAGFRPTVQLENPLDTAGKVMQLRAQQNQNALFPGQQQLQDQAVQGGAIDVANKVKSAGYSAMAPLLALPAGSITHDNFAATAAGVEKHLGLPTGALVDDLGSNPMGDGPGFDAYARSLIASRSQNSPANAVGVLNRSGTIIDDGGTLRPATTGGAAYADNGAPQLTGQGLTKDFAPTFTQNGQRAFVPTIHGNQPVGPGVQQQMTPAQLAEPYQIGSGPQGQKIMGTVGDYLQQTGHPPPGYGAPTSPLGTGRLPVPGALLNGAPAPGAGPAPAGPNGQPVGPVSIGISPGKETALRAGAENSASAFNDMRKDGQNAQNDIAVYGNMLADLKSFSPGQIKVNDFKNLITRYAPSLAASFNVSPESVAAAESFSKLSHQAELAQGSGSDSRLSVAGLANPSMANTPAGADLLLRGLQGNGDYKRAMADMAAQYPDKEDAAKFQSQFAHTFDPRAFQFARMTPAQQATYGESLSPTDRKVIGAAYKNALDQGLITRANQQ